MDRDRSIERETAGTNPRQDETLIVEERAKDRVVVDRHRDAAGDAAAPTDQDVLVRQDAADTMPSRALNDPRELTPDQMQRFSADTTAAPSDAVAPSGAMDAGGDVGRSTNMAGRPLETPPPAGTGSGSSAGGVFAQIREGMRVIDAAGEDLGKIDFFSAGDPEAITTEGQEVRDATGTGVFGELGRALTGADAEPNVPEPFRSRLVREGFIKVDGKGWFDTDRYLTAEMIGRVVGDEVHLTVTRDSIANDQGKER